MLQSVTHEPFYRVGTWRDEGSGLYVGWTVRKNAFADCMPISDPGGDWTMIFSGEDFSAECAVTNNGQRDFESVHWAASNLISNKVRKSTFPADLNGLFHGLIVEHSKGTVKLFNDRYGMHRLYYHEAGDTFYFAAEAKAILAVCPATRCVDAQGMSEYVSCSCVLENRSLFRGIQVLPPGSSWSFRRGIPERKDFYFASSDWEALQALEPEAYYQQLRDAVSQIVPRYFKGQERIGLSLTGGLDTRLILAWQRPEAGTLPCYTFGGEYRDCHDVLIARKVAHACRQTHEVIRVGAEFLENFAHYAERTIYLSDGCSGVNRSADLYVNEQARQIAPIRMTGNYGDEVLRHIRVFKPTEPAANVFQPEVNREIGRAHDTYTDCLRGHPLSFALFRQAPWHSYSLLCLEQTQLLVRTPFFDNDLVRTLFRAPKSASANNNIRVRLINEGNPNLGAIQTDLGFCGAKTLSAVSQRFHALTMKAEYAFDHGMPQQLAMLDHWLAPLHPEKLFLGRHKFYHFRIWYRDRLAKYVREMLLDPLTLSRPYLDKKGVRRIVEGHLKGNRNYTTEIHKILTLELVHRLFVDARD